MKVKIRTKEVHFSMPIPLHMIGLVIKMIPDRVFREMREQTPKPYDCLITKKNVGLILAECMDILKENKDLEAVHVEAADGTFVSIKL